MPGYRVILRACIAGCGPRVTPIPEGGSREAQRLVLVINCVRSGKYRVKDFVIRFTSSPSTADERPVIPFLNLTGYPQRDRDAATGSCLVRGTSSRVGSLAVETPGAL